MDLQIDMLSQANQLTCGKFILYRASFRFAPAPMNQDNGQAKAPRKATRATTHSSRPRADRPVVVPITHSAGTAGSAPRTFEGPRASGAADAGDPCRGDTACSRSGLLGTMFPRGVRQGEWHPLHSQCQGSRQQASGPIR